MFRLTMLAVTAFFVAAALCQAQGTYTIKFKEEKDGDTVKFKKTENKKSTTSVRTGDGAVLKDTAETEIKDYLYVSTISKPAGREEERMADRYEKARITKDGQQRVSGLEGKTVVFDKKKDGQYKIRFEDGTELSDEQVDDLADNPAKKKAGDFSDKDFLPPGPVKLNETWSISPKIFEKADDPFSKVLDLDKAKLTGKLVRVHKKEGCQFGVIEVDLNIPLKKDTELGEGLKIESGLVRLQVTLDISIDGGSHSGTANGTLAIELRAGGDVQGITVRVVSGISGGWDETREEVRKQ